MITCPLVFGLGPWEIVIICFVILLLFGGKKIPEMMKGLGKGVKSFKDGMKEEDGEGKYNRDEVKKIKDVDSTKVEDK